MDNGIAKMNISLNGGTIKSLSLNSNDVNVLHDYGHFICFDHWGPSSPEDEALGIPFHGEASKIKWTLLGESNPDENTKLVEMSCLLPIVKLGMNRKIYQGSGSSVFKIVEEISNHTDSTRVFNLVQHPTIGAPLLDETCIVDTRVDSGFSQNGPLPPGTEDIFTWPDALVDGDATDLRYLATDHSWNSAVVTYILDEKKEYAWVSAVNPSLNLMVGYLWPIDEYPWLNLWLRLRNGAAFARGLEFGSTGLHQAWPELLETDTIFGKKLYEEIDVDETVLKSYYAFLAELPSNYKGVAAISLSDDTIRIEEYEMDPERSIMLNIKGVSTGTYPFESASAGDISLSQNTPNPVDYETLIEYMIADKGQARIEVFNALGQSVKVLIDEAHERGNHKVLFNASALPEGLYFYSLSSKGQQLQKRMLVVH